LRYNLLSHIIDNNKLLVNLNNFLLPRKNRIKKTDFKKIFAEAKAIRTSVFTLLYTSSKIADGPQFAVVISTKVEPKAAKRNKIKRQIRKILQEEIKKTNPNNRIIVICKPEITKMKFEKIQNLIKDVLKQRDLLPK
jgi:ribonuclease P protein component